MLLLVPSFILPTSEIFDERIALSESSSSKFINSLDVWGKDNVSTISYEEFKNLNATNNKVTQLGNSMNGIDSLSCSSDGSCDGKVTLEKSTTKNY